MKVSVYMPTDLRERLRTHGGINVSKVCQTALEAELVHVQALAGLDADMDRVHLSTVDDGNVVFTGRRLTGRPWGDGELTVWLTGRHRIAVHWGGEHAGLQSYDTFREFAAGWDEHVPELVAEVAQVLGVAHHVELDI